MSPDANRRLSALHAVARALQLSLSEHDAGQLLVFLDLLERWNSTYNLTAVRDPWQMLYQHIGDCLAVIRPLQRQLGTSPNRRILDVGSGAGLPGIVISLLCPEWDVVCVDAVGKKSAFIQQASTELSLAKLRAVHARVEDLVADPFDLITSRAFSSLAEFVRLTRVHLSPTGVWMAMKGKVPIEEMTALENSDEVFHVEQLVVPGIHANRCLVWIRPRIST